MAVEYCNLTTHLLSAYSDIEQYKGMGLLTDWEFVSGAVYKFDKSGYIEMVFDDGVPLTEESTETTTPAAGKFSYYTDTDTLYIRLTGDADPAASVMEKGPPWETRKQRARNDAQEMLEGFLGNVFPTPFQKVISPDISYNSELYDYWIRRATALLTCWILVKDINPNDPAVDLLYKEVDNPNPEVGEKLGIVQRILNGEVVLKMQRLAREAGGFNMFEGSSNAATAFFDVFLPSGVHSVATEQIWRIQMDTAGAPGTATYKISKDGGSTFDDTLQDTTNDGDDKRIHLGAGIYCRFVGTFVENDYIDLHLYPSTDSVTVQKYGNLKLRR